jgi:hypothetical protein
MKKLFKRKRKAAPAEPPVVPKPKLMYDLTKLEDGKKALLESMALASMRALQDYPDAIVQDPEQIENIARAAVIKLRDLPGYTLTNNFSELCSIMIPAFTDTYQQTINIYSQHPEQHAAHLAELRREGDPEKTYVKIVHGLEVLAAFLEQQQQQKEQGAANER